MATAYQKHVKAIMAKRKPKSLVEARAAMREAGRTWRQRNPAPAAANPCQATRKANPTPIVAPRPNPRPRRANPAPLGNPCPGCGGMIANPLPAAFNCPYCGVGLENS